MYLSGRPHIRKSTAWAFSLLESECRDVEKSGLCAYQAAASPLCNDWMIGSPVQEEGRIFGGRTGVKVKSDRCCLRPGACPVDEVDVGVSELGSSRKAEDACFSCRLGVCQ